jgi:hypothetical protein
MMRDPSTAVLLKTAAVLASLLLFLWALGAGWVTRWLFGLALGGLLVVGDVLVLLAIL